MDVKEDVIGDVKGDIKGDIRVDLRGATMGDIMGDVKGDVKGYIDTTSREMLIGSSRGSLRQSSTRTKSALLIPLQSDLLCQNLKRWSLLGMFNETCLLCDS